MCAPPKEAAAASIIIVFVIGYTRRDAYVAYPSPTNPNLHTHTHTNHKPAGSGMGAVWGLVKNGLALALALAEKSVFTLQGNGNPSEVSESRKAFSW
jgi:hypothetical protein